MAKLKRQLRITNLADKTAELLFYGPIGLWWGDDGITASEFAREIRQLGQCRQLRLVIDSEGGDVFQAADIYATLREADIDELIVDVRGICASAATLVAMAGDKICAAENATWMVHGIQGGVYGGIADLEDYLKVLRDLDDTTKRIYAARTGCTRAKLDELLSRDSYLTAAEAEDLGFVDEVYEVANKRMEPATNRITLPPPTARLDCDLQDARRSIARLATCATAAEGIRGITPPARQLNGGTPVAESTSTPVTPPAPVVAPPAAPPATPPVAVVNTFDADSAAEVISLCAMAGCADKAAGYVKTKTPLDVVRGQLFQHVCANRQLTPPPAGGSPDPVRTDSPEAKAGAEFDANKKAIVAMGISREQYIATYLKDQETE